MAELITIEFVTVTILEHPIQYVVVQLEHVFCLSLVELAFCTVDMIAETLGKGLWQDGITFRLLQWH